MHKLTAALAVGSGVFMAGNQAFAAGLILNEANAVGSTKWLNNPDGPTAGCPQPEGPGGVNCNSEEDVFFGRVLGNGGDWIELVVTIDHLDIRGWQLRWAEIEGPPGGSATHANGTDLWYGNGNVEQGIITFSNHAIWSDLRAGTILTIAERTSALGGLDTDLSFEPCTGDWWINVNSFDVQYINTVTNKLNENSVPPYSQTEAPGNFSVGNDMWEVTILDSASTVVLGPIGEGFAGGPGWQGSGVNSRETIRLSQHPSASIDELSFYEDSNQSSFGHSNRWSENAGPGVTCGRFQDFRSMRSWSDCGCARVVLNEYNAVGPAMYLNGGTAGVDQSGGAAADPLFGRILGNGGNWFELVVTDDHLDMRNWTLVWEEVADSQSGTIVLSNHPAWSNLRAGTIITFIRENTADGGLDSNLSYDPAGGDRWINIWTADSAYVASTTSTVRDHEFGDFHTSNDDWRLSILDGANQLQSMSSGEGSDGYGGRGVGNDEVGSLEQDPSTATTSWDLYNESIRSTFGAANQWKPCPGAAIVTQSFTPLLAGACIQPPDTNADGVVNVDDLLNIINGWGQCAAPGIPCPGDVTNNGEVNVDDLLAVINSWS